MTLTFPVQTSIRYHNGSCGLLSWLYKSACILEILKRVSWHAAVSKQNLPHGLLKAYLSNRAALEEWRSLQGEDLQWKCNVPYLDQVDKFHCLAGRILTREMSSNAEKMINFWSIMSADTKNTELTLAHRHLEGCGDKNHIPTVCWVFNFQIRWDLAFHHAM